MRTWCVAGIILLLAACGGRTPGAERWDGTLDPVRPEPLEVAGPGGDWAPWGGWPLQLLWVEDGYLALASEYDQGYVYLRLEWLDAASGAATRSGRATDDYSVIDDAPMSGVAVGTGADVTLFYTDDAARLWVRQVGTSGADLVLGVPRLLHTGAGTYLTVTHALRTDAGYALLLSSDLVPYFLGTSIQGEPQGDLVALRDPGPEARSEVTDVLLAETGLRVLVSERDPAQDQAVLLTLDLAGATVAAPLVLHAAADVIGGALSADGEGGVVASLWDLAVGTGLVAVADPGAAAAPVFLADPQYHRPRHLRLDDDRVAVLAESGELSPENPSATTLSLLAVDHATGATALTRPVSAAAPGTCIENQVMAAGEGSLGVLWVQDCLGSGERELYFRSFRTTTR